MAELFGKAKSTINEHIQNIYNEKELIESETMYKFGISEFVQKTPNYYNLDVIISVGCRVKSLRGTEFRKWATKTLKKHIIQGFTINPNRIEKNHQAFLQTVEDAKLLVQNNQNVQTEDILELIKSFFYTWFSLDSYDKDKFPKTGTKKSVEITAEELERDLKKLKQELITKKEATDIFEAFEQCRFLSIFDRVFAPIDLSVLLQQI